MNTQIPLTGIVLFIAFGTLVFIIVFVFVKRQITRFTLKASRGPYTPIGYGAPRILMDEINKRLNRVKEIKCDPQLIHKENLEELKQCAQKDPSHYYYRMHAVDGVLILYTELKDCGIPKRRDMSLKTCLMEHKQVGFLQEINIDLINTFCRMFDHARHDPKPFTKQCLDEFNDILNTLLAHIRLKRRKSEDRSPSPTEKSDKSDSSQQLLMSRQNEYKQSQNPNLSAVTILPRSASSQRSINYAVATNIKTGSATRSIGKSKKI